MWSLRKKLEIPAPEQCLPGRAIRMRVPDQHFVNGHKLAGPYPAGLEQGVFSAGGLKLHNFYGSSECGGIAYDSLTEPRSDSSC